MLADKSKISFPNKRQMKQIQKYRCRSSEHERAQTVKPVAGFDIHAGELRDDPEEAVIGMRKNRRAGANGQDDQGFFDFTDESQ